MAYSEEKKQDIFNNICEYITNGKSLRKALLNCDNLPAGTFFEWMREDELKSKQYARATEERAQLMFEDMMDIASNDPERTQTKFGTAVDSGSVQDKRVRIDTMKWAMSKMMPKKYGDKLDITTDGEKINTLPITQEELTKAKESFNNEL